MSIKSASVPTRRMWASEKFSRRMCIVATGRVAGRMVLKYDGADIIGGLSFFSVFFTSFFFSLSHSLRLFPYLVKKLRRPQQAPTPVHARPRRRFLPIGMASGTGSRRRRRDQRRGQSWQDKSGKRTTLFFTLPKSTFREKKYGLIINDNYVYPHASRNSRSPSFSGRGSLGSSCLLSLVGWMDELSQQTGRKVGTKCPPMYSIRVCGTWRRMEN